jgi:hypothetical protein
MLDIFDLEVEGFQRWGTEPVKAAHSLLEIPGTSTQ